MNAPALSALDRLFLERAYELAMRGIGNTSPNPQVGAVVVRDGAIAGEGYHHRAGLAHAEINALAQAGDARGATVYISLEPCNHAGRTPPCSQALVDAGVARVVVGTTDPNPKTNGGGIALLRERGIQVDIADDATARRLIERFAGSIDRDRPYLALKMAMSLDGFITSKPSVQERLTCEAGSLYVRDLRIAYDAVMVGAGTVRVDDPQLTVRPPHHRLRPYVRVILCEADTIPVASRALAAVPEYAASIILAPAGARSRFANLQGEAETIFVGDENAQRLDLLEAMRALGARGLRSVLCEGGPTLGGRLIVADLVDRVYWAIAPVFLCSSDAVPVLAGVDLASLRKRIVVDAVECVGDDVVISGTFDRKKRVTDV